MSTAWPQRWLCSTSTDRCAASITIDSFLLPCCGTQPGVAYNGRYRDNGYHPLVASFTDGRMMDFLTDEKARFLGRLKSNPVLDRLAEPHLKRPVGRPPREGCEDVIDLGPYRAEPWRHAQRLILVIIDRPDPQSGQLQFEPDYFFLVTNWRKEVRTGLQGLGLAAIPKLRAQGQRQSRQTCPADRARGCPRRRTFLADTPRAAGEVGRSRALASPRPQPPRLDASAAPTRTSLSCFAIDIPSSPTLHHPHAAHNSALGERGELRTQTATPPN